MKTIEKHRTRHTAEGHAVLPHDRELILEILRKTAGLWRGKKINPLVYQRAMRRSYATSRKGK